MTTVAALAQIIPRSVAYHKVRCRCPNCKLPNPRVTRTPPRIGVRYHKCRCGYRFKSFDVDE